MKNAHLQNSKVSALDKRNYTSKLNRAAIVIGRIMALAHPDIVPLAALFGVLLWGAL